jgi:hypothetical protein
MFTKEIKNKIVQKKYIAQPPLYVGGLSPAPGQSEAGWGAPWAAGVGRPPRQAWPALARVS